MPTLTCLRVCCSVALAALLAACQSTPPPAASPAPAAAAATPLLPAPPAPILEPTVRVGGDVDAHGCKPSAGYAWCSATQRCERPWELALQRGFANSPAGWLAFCENQTR